MLRLERNNGIGYCFGYGGIDKEAQSLVVMSRLTLERTVGQLDLDVESTSETMSSAQANPAGSRVDVSELKRSFQYLCGLVRNLDAQFSTSEIGFTLANGAYQRVSII